MESRAFKSSSWEVAKVFLRLGCTAFGGPAAHVAMMQTEFVDRKGWLKPDEFMDLVGASNLIPGPSSTELAIAIGFRRAGWLGLVLAGVCFILPAALIVSVLAAIAVRADQSHVLAGAFAGAKPVVVAIVGQALVLLSKRAANSWIKQAAVGVGFILALIGIGPIMILFGFGAGFALATEVRQKTRDWRPMVQLGKILATLALLPIALSIIPSLHDHATPALLFLYFLKIGSIIYGSGYVLLNFLQAELVERWHWLSLAQLSNAIAVGQFTPGPVFTTATFIGYVLAGSVGAVAATLGIFLPAFLFVAVSGKSIFSLRESVTTSAFVDGINCAAVGLMAAVEWTLVRDSLNNVLTIAVAALSVVILLRTKLNASWLVLGGAISGALLLR